MAATWLFVSPTAPYLPAGHGSPVHTRRPAVDVCCPAGHATQPAAADAAPVTVPNCPAEHCVHAAADTDPTPAEYVPASHAVHTEPACAVNLPAAQLVQESAFVEASGVDRPAAHFSHDGLAVPGWYWPAAHASQEVRAPATAAYLPAGQGTQPRQRQGEALVQEVPGAAALKWRVSPPLV